MGKVKTERDRIIERYTYLIKKVAYKLIARLPPNVELDDLMSAGVIGLIDAVEKFDPEKNTNFPGYATIRIRGAMIDELRSLDWVPRSVRQKGAAIEAVSAKLTRALGCQPTDAEIAREMNLTIGEYYRLLYRVRLVNVVSYEDIGAADSDDRNFLSCVADPNSTDPEAIAERYSDCEHTMRVLGKLPQRQRIVLILYYYEDVNQADIASLIGVTESRVSQIRSAAICAVREHLEQINAIAA